MAEKATMISSARNRFEEILFFFFFFYDGRMRRASREIRADTGIREKAVSRIVGEACSKVSTVIHAGSNRRPRDTTSLFHRGLFTPLRRPPPITRMTSPGGSD